MGADITVYAEARSGKKGKPYRFIGELNADRNYYMFTAMGYELAYFEPVYRARGLPGDVTNVVYLEYKKYCEAHHPSWLSAQELMDCIQYCEKLYEMDGGHHESFLKIYKLLKEYNDQGDEARIVFWFS